MRPIVLRQVQCLLRCRKTDATSGELHFDELDIMELIVQIEETPFVSISNEEFTSPGGENGWKAITALCPAELMQAKT